MIHKSFNQYYYFTTILLIINLTIPFLKISLPESLPLHLDIKITTILVTIYIIKYLIIGNFCIYALIYEH